MIVPMLSAAALVLAVGPHVRPARRPTGRPAAGSGGAPSRAVDRFGRRWVAVTMVLAALTIEPVLAVALCLGAVSWPLARRVLDRRARRRAIDAALPDMIELLILVVHAGMTPHQAVVLLGDRAPKPVRPALHEVERRMSRGTPLADALDALPDVLGPDAAVVADTLAMSDRYGTPIGEALAQLALDVRERRRRRAEADARTLPIRMSFPLVVCTLPSFVLVAIVPALLAAMTSLGDTGL